jgi:hypothetical protein
MPADIPLTTFPLSASYHALVSHLPYHLRDGWQEPGEKSPNPQIALSVWAPQSPRYQFQNEASMMGPVSFMVR